MGRTQGESSDPERGRLRQYEDRLVNFCCRGGARSSLSRLKSRTVRLFDGKKSGNMAGDERPGVEQTTSQEAVEGEPRSVKIKRVLRKIYAIVSSTLGLVFVLILYSFLGAAIFTAIEGKHEVVEKLEILDIRNSVLHSAWNYSQWYGETEEDFRSAMEEELHRYEIKLHEAFTHGVNSDSTQTVWDFWGAFLFCATVYTTIGYGHIAPATSLGRVVTMIYALFGIPLCLLVMAHLGKKLTLGIKFLWSFIRRCYYTGHCRKIRKTLPTEAIKDHIDSATQAVKEGLEKLDIRRPSAMPDDGIESAPTVEEPKPDDEKEATQFQVDEEFNLPPLVAIGIMIFYILIGAAMYRKWEDNWSYLDACYFIFISVSTVGFGDVLPDHPRYFLISSLYILLGLSLVAMVINVFMEVVHNTIDKAKETVIDMGQKMGINLSEEELEKAGVDEDSKDKECKDTNTNVKDDTETVKPSEKYKV